MDIRDFQGLEYFRFLVPVLYITSWIGMFAGPYFIPFSYRQYCFAFTLYLFLVSINNFVINFLFIMKSNQALKRVEDNKNNPFKLLNQVDRQIYHAFIIPNYKEDIELLAQTLQVLAKHTRAQYIYLVFLAMEQDQLESSKKAKKLINKFKDKFKFIDFTSHQIREFQQKGKASNVSWCAQKLSSKIQKLNINENNIILTIMDADSWAPNGYFDQIERHIYQNFEKRHKFIFQPTQIYSRNNMDASTIVRTYEDTYAALHATNLITLSKFTFSFSNYSLSYNLVKQVGYWDTIEQCIGQDVHMTIKCFFKTTGQIEMIPILIPFNQLNLMTGKGFIEDLKSKFWQLERHSRGTSQIGYSILMLCRNKFSFKSLWFVIIVIETILLPVIGIWPTLSVLINDQFLEFNTFQGVLSASSFIFLYNLMNIQWVLKSFIYSYYKQKASRILYGIKCRSIFYQLQNLLTYTFNIFIMLLGSYIVGSFLGIKRNRQYINGPKFNSRSKIINIQQQSVSISGQKDD